MPVIRYIPQDPTDLVIQGEQLRLDATAMCVHCAPAPMAMAPMLSAMPAPNLNPPVLIAGEQDYVTTLTERYLPHARLKSNDNGWQIAANALIATPCGALYPIQLGRHLMDDFVESTQSFTMVGQTLTGAGAALGACRVVVLETGRVSVTSPPPLQFYSTGNPNPGTWQTPSPVVGETISDGSGNFSIPVPMNTAYWLMAYLTGAPDRAGITRHDVVPTSTVNIYMRDPTVQDGPGGGAVFRPIGSPVIRRIDQ